MLRALTSHTPYGIFRSDSQGKCVYVNERWCELAGLSVDQALGDGWMAALHPDDLGRVLAEWREAGHPDPAFWIQEKVTEILEDQAA